MPWMMTTTSSTAQGLLLSYFVVAACILDTRCEADRAVFAPACHERGCGHVAESGQEKKRSNSDEPQF